VGNKDTTTDNVHSSSKKKNHSIEKQQQIHREEMAAFRRRLNIHLGKHCDTSIDQISSFEEMTQPTWWKEEENNNIAFNLLKRVILKKIRAGKMVRTNPYTNAMHSRFAEREEGYFGSSTDWKW
jgi:hypothetical protein